MRINGTALALAGMGVAGTLMVVAPVLSSVTSAKPEPVVAEPSAPTITATPNATTTKEALDAGVAAYIQSIKDSGGVEENLFTANGYASTVKLAPNGAVDVKTNAPTIPEVMQIGRTQYVQLGGEELTSSEALRKKAGKPTATWTTSTAKLAPTLRYWLTPPNLSTTVAGFAPGIELQNYVRQTDGTATITSNLFPERITDPNIRAAFNLPSPKKPTPAGTYRVDFGLNSSGVLTRVVVTTTGTPVQIVVTRFAKVDVTPPAPAVTITPVDIKRATKPARSR